MPPRDRFERTSCARQDCRSLCKNMPGMLAAGDAERIGLHLRRWDIGEFLLASPGALVMRADTGQAVRIPTIVPARKADGSCVFLDEQERCTIHPVAPFGCSHFDHHMNPKEGDRRCKAALADVANDHRYQVLWTRLAAAGRFAEDPVRARARILRQEEEAAKKSD